MKQDQPNDSGRAWPVSIEGSEFIFPVDNVIPSIETRPNLMLSKAILGLKTHPCGGLMIDECKVETRQGPVDLAS